VHRKSSQNSPLKIYRREHSKDLYFHPTENFVYLTWNFIFDHSYNIAINTKPGMKNTLRLFAAAALLSTGLLFSSCTREFTCQCTITYSGQPGLPDPIMKEYTITDSKKNADKKCEDHSETNEINGITTVEDCKLW